MSRPPAREVSARQVHDVRLAPAALACWLAAWLATGTSGASVRVAAAAVLAGTALLAVLLAVLVLRRQRGRTPVPRRTTGALAGVVLLGACCGTVLTLTAAELGRREAPAVAALAARGGAASVDLVVTGDPLSGRGTQSWQQEQVRVPVELVRLRLPSGGSAEVAVPALLTGDESWAGARWGERRRTVVRLRAAPAGEAYAVFAAVAGPSAVVGQPRWWWRAAERLRAGLTGAATAGPQGPVGDGAALLPGLVVGDTSLQRDDLVDDLRVAGLSHLSSVSGANVSLVCGGVLLLVVLLRGGRRRGAALAAAALVALVVVARPEPSVLRAAVMGSVGLLGALVGRRGGGTSALCLAVVAVLVLDPWMSRAAGFRLSVLATAALVVCTLPWSRALGRVVPRPVAVALAVPAAAQVAVTPVLVGLEPVVSLYALPANVLAAPAVAPATVLGLLAALLSLVHADLAAMVAAPARWCAGWIAGVGRTAADLPGASVPVPEGLLGAALAGGGSVGALVLGALLLRVLPDRRAEGQVWAPWRRPPAGPAPLPSVKAVPLRVPGAASVSAGVVDPRLAALGAAVLVLVAVLVLRLAGVLPGRADPWPGAAWAVVVCDVGQGESVLVRAGPDSAVVVDTGPQPAPVERCLRRAGVTQVPVLVLTHLHADHVGGLDGVAAAARVEAVWTSAGGMPRGVEADLTRWAGAVGAPVARPSTGTSAVVGDVRVDVLATGTPGAGEGDAQDVNDAGLVVRLDTGTLSLLAVGDVGSEVQQRLLREVPEGGLRADVTTVAHHGSSDQLPAFYAAVGARVAVASAGRDNTYGHPTARSRDVVAASGARVLSTAADGDVALRAVGADGTEGPAGADGAVASAGDRVTVGVRTTRRGGRRPPALGRGRTCPPSVPA